MTSKFGVYYWYIILMTSLSFQLIGWWAVVLGIIALPIWSDRVWSKKLDDLDEEESNE